MILQSISFQFLNLEMNQEWDWNVQTGTIDVTPFLLFESTADSDDHDISQPDGHRHHQQEQEQEEIVMDDDAESCSQDRHLHTNTKGHDHNHDQDRGGLIYGYDDGDDEDEDEDIDDEMNWGESKMMDARNRKQEKRCHKDSASLDLGNQSDIDRQFWETCLAS